MEGSVMAPTYRDFRNKRHGFWQWTARLAMVPVAIYYAFIVFLTQYTGWHGVLGLYEHHAFLLPVPF